MDAADLYNGEEKTGGGAIAYRSSGEALTVFFDGHVEALPREAVVKSGTLWGVDNK